MKSKPDIVVGPNNELYIEPMFHPLHVIMLLDSEARWLSFETTGGSVVRLDDDIEFFKGLKDKSTYRSLRDAKKHHESALIIAKAS